MAIDRIEDVPPIYRNDVLEQLITDLMSGAEDTEGLPTQPVIEKTSFNSFTVVTGQESEHKFTVIVLKGIGDK